MELFFFFFKMQNIIAYVYAGVIKLVEKKTR